MTDTATAAPPPIYDRRNRPDKRGPAPVEPVEADRQLEEIIDTARQILRRYSDLYEHGYKRAQYGEGGRSASGHSDVSGTLTGAQEAREQLMTLCDHMGKSLSNIAGALKAADKAESLIDESHPAAADRDERQRERTAFLQELLESHQAAARRIETQIQAQARAEKVREAKRRKGRPVAKVIAHIPTREERMRDRTDTAADEIRRAGDRQALPTSWNDGTKP